MSLSCATWHFETGNKQNKSDNLALNSMSYAFDDATKGNRETKKKTVENFCGKNMCVEQIRK